MKKNTKLTWAHKKSIPIASRKFVTDGVVWLVTANTCLEEEQGDYGAEIEVFGIATNLSELKKLKRQVEKIGYKPKQTKITLDMYTRKYLGGYVE